MFYDSLLLLIYIVYPFTDPIITPFTKYFCTNGYRHITGTVDTKIREYFNSSAIPCFAAAISGSRIIVASILFAIRISLSTS